ncbi:nucleoside 2-deoxyribosyltransferase [Bradyrhizobium sp. 166]|uniref:nucleoside 2-deoxyribosyltransferase n=1 Tax=Bradyrhizobium sp. 166 TaxID=2782638 RepID=UPI001FF94B77|nr:PfkB family carbohydrate kinase [Bradyrhizobium sp. 166]MCK1604693.1 nucleoside 2-deoxyribosyltransferase [Bradyrhizobium sp. 166]
MIIAGGTYLELCLRPEWHRIFGSGLRATCASAELSPGTVLHTYAFGEWADDIRHSAAAFGCVAKVTSTDTPISFSYDHPLSRARCDPRIVQRNPPLVVEGQTVLRFAFVEGDAVVTADRAVYDPQSSHPQEPFSANGSVARSLALVLNQDEAEGGGTAQIDDLLDMHRAELAVVKRGPFGATVHARATAPVHVPAYKSESVFKIGSGDVFSAAFAAHWGERGLDPAVAADLASRSAAQFVDGHVLPIPSVIETAMEPVMGSHGGRIYVAGPFFDLPQRWMIEQAAEALTSFGVEIFSPLHEVGTGLPDQAIAEADLAGLRTCTKVWAVLDGADPGTVFEVGYARALGIPVVALAERLESTNLTMMRGSGCEVVQDFATSIYHLIWAADR